jgi:hypothetical protein
MYDAGIGRFLSVDPLWKQFPSLTPFQFSSNTPIQATDLDGAEGRLDLPSSDPNVQRMNKIQRQQYDKGVIHGAASGVALFGAVLSAPAVGSAAVSFGSSALFWSLANPGTAQQIGVTGIGIAAGIAGYEGDLPGEGDDVGRAASSASKAALNSSKVLDEVADVGKVVHGNSKASMKAQHGYAIIDKKTGKIKEFGISGQELRPNGTSPRIDQKIRKKYDDPSSVEGKIIETNLPNRQSAIDWETGKVQEFIFKHGKKPENQFRP